MKPENSGPSFRITSPVKENALFEDPTTGVWHPTISEEYVVYIRLLSNREEGLDLT